MDPVYPVLFVDAIVVKVRDGQVRNTPFYVVMGVTVNGERENLGIWAGNGGEGARFWLQVFSELKNRGVEDVLIAVCDGLKGLPEAITTTWERTVVQQCMHRAPDPQQLPLRRTPAPRRHRQGAQAGLHGPVRASGEGPVRRVHAEWGQPFPAIVRLWESSWAEFVPFMEYDVEIRRMISLRRSMGSRL
ncbi:transposase-like protein [Arthrobacter globiformis]|uniref:transposase n=1 Tax=Arthrobacter globiformis TaxID=1665 RepID=UPI00278A66A6|nr:transposase-like protein [Arthrobacter globiformis]